MNNGIRFTSTKVAGLNQTFIDASPQEILRWANDYFGTRLVLSSAFGAEDIVLIDMMSKIVDRPRIFILDTGRMHQETYDVIECIRAKYEIDFDFYFPQADAVERLQREKGPNSFYESIDNRRECCLIRKVEPLGRALRSVDAWITGLRRSQSVTRTGLQPVEIDEAHGGILKINPLINWSEEQVWDYIRSNGVPYNALHDKGFPSIGCASCTRAIQPGEDLRAGRWWWESPEHKECGLHIKDGKAVKINER
ncbi:MAG: phosphoadenylyl-sulfate reductase [Armatimonadota bacterium]